MMGLLYRADLRAYGVLSGAYDGNCGKIGEVEVPW